MKTTLFVLCSEGDIELKWDASSPEETEKARTAVADLQQQGYVFFLVDGTPADAVTAGQGELVVRKISAEELIGAKQSLESYSAEPLPVSEAPSDQPATPLYTAEPLPVKPKKGARYGLRKPQPEETTTAPATETPQGEAPAPAEQVAVAARRPRGG